MHWKTLSFIGCALLGPAGVVSSAFSQACPGEGYCFAGNGTPGCSDADCCAIVCDVDRFCCNTEWDDLCGSLAIELCLGCGAAGAGACLEPHASPGCADSACCQTVCVFDPFCCETEWDTVCVANAVARCGFPPDNDDCADALDVAGGMTPFSTHYATDDPPLDLCGAALTGANVWFRYEADFFGRVFVRTCEASFNTTLHAYGGCGCPPGPPMACSGDNLGCANPEGSVVAAEVAAGDCLLFQVSGFEGERGFGTLVVEEIPLECGSIDAGDCFSPGGTPFCSDSLCCEIVCTFDPFCCETQWDAMCVEGAIDRCNCGGAATGSCFTAAVTPSCDDAVCCELVCSIDLYCCTTFWDELCVTEAAALCLGCGGNGDGDCFEANGTTACANTNCCLAVCVSDPFCCDTEWDLLCAKTAESACCLPDVTRDGVVDVDDLIDVILAWGSCPPPGTSLPEACTMDIDGNRLVDVDDLLAIIIGWGPCP